MVEGETDRTSEIIGGRLTLHHRCFSCSCCVPAFLMVDAMLLDGSVPVCMCSFYPAWPRIQSHLLSVRCPSNSCDLGCLLVIHSKQGWREEWVAVRLENAQNKCHRHPRNWAIFLGSLTSVLLYTCSYER